MNVIKCNISINEADTSIEISGLEDDSIIIDYSDDIDFTILVTTLGKVIDQGKKIFVEKDNIPTGISDKLNLVLLTIDRIFESYNKVLDEHNPGDEEDDEQYNNDDLPF